MHRSATLAASGARAENAYAPYRPNPRRRTEGQMNLESAPPPSACLYVLLFGRNGLDGPGIARTVLRRLGDPGAPQEEAHR